MGFGPSDAKELTYWEYTAIVTEWQARHSTDDDDEDMPDFETMKAGLITFKENHMVN